MHKYKIVKNIPLLLLVLVNSLLVLTIFSLMGYAQNLLNSDIQTNLNEIVIQNKDVINNSLSNEVNKLNLISSQLSERYSQKQIPLEQIFTEFANDKNESQLFIALPNGIAYLPDGGSLDINGRKYFRLALEGQSNISDRLISRANGSTLFVMSAPITSNNEIIGTIQRQFTLEQMYDLCSSSLYTDKGYTYIINSDGYIIIGSQDEEYTPESDNLFRLLFIDNPNETRILQEHINTNTTGFMKVSYRGTKIYASYTPLDKVYDWYLVSSVKTNAVLPNVQTVVKIFYVVLFVLFIGFLLSSSYFFYSRLEQEKKLRKLAFIDPVTGLDTYTKFQFDLQSILQSNPTKKFFIFTFDVDNFKYINNYYGYNIGDSILTIIHKLYSETLLSNELCARLYSDHFVMLLEDASTQRLNSLFSSEITIDNIIVYLSAGIYEITDSNENVNLMVDKANLASKNSKGTHHKKVEFYNVELDKKLIQNEQAKRAIEKAIQDDEIVPFFQPKININTNKIEGAEALARWITKAGIIIPPSDFIPLSEKTGLIHEIDFIILEKTLRFLRKCLDDGINCTPISINFSRMHLMSHDFIVRLISKINEYQIPPKLIEIELTETVIFDNYQIIEDFINHLHEHGLQISMDDFGSGYSSLNMLKDIEIDVIKFDRGFLQDTQKSERQKVILSAITNMAVGLGIKVVVEGVETQENVNLMKEYGCTIAQGYYYAKPMPIDQFEIIFKEGKL
ncbi:bifunctional diguanylate cyclase/phosphodiesterase [Anaerorhabdus furcosa]|uniref:Diguanylate cyclase (GGDEF) domain-containing protein n=1 Tax=Anaerorhabdus furcosa TaxID=118967 RepID=A0A1T4KNC0_9FIRM|nr:GGDEF domain-containing protein [Anaerorhabdus furcosa]SJZ43900.1 diguanylate cyclase (GGDEF) domain-containing protein [Anaerorhabdus furcosa]